MILISEEPTPSNNQYYVDEDLMIHRLNASSFATVDNSKDIDLHK